MNGGHLKIDTLNVKAPPSPMGSGRLSPIASPGAKVRTLGLNSKDRSRVEEQREVSEIRNSMHQRKRKDRFGNVIGRAQKRHRVTFVDEVEGKSISNVYYVESFKKYNTLDDGHNKCCSVL